MIPRYVFSGLAIVMVFAGCSVLRNSPKYGFTEGSYQSRLFSVKRSVYVVPSDDTIKVYAVHKGKSNYVDTLQTTKLIFPPNQIPSEVRKQLLRKNTFDIDVLTIPFKYRPAVRDFPRQLNTTFNGAIYLGYRSDLYHITYRRTPLRLFQRTITHYGYSVGLFTGIGSARIDEYVTNNSTTIQYDGVVSLSGINIIIGVEKVSIGLAGGIDHLLDVNHKSWVNNGKLWLGFSFGLNLN